MSDYINRPPCGPPGGNSQADIQPIFLGRDKVAYLGRLIFLTTAPARDEAV